MLFKTVEFPVDCGHEAGGSLGHSSGDREAFYESLSYGKMLRQRHRSTRGVSIFLPSRLRELSHKHLEKRKQSFNL